MVDYVTRPEWGAAPPKRPMTVWNPNKLAGVVVHWLGSPNGAATHAGCDDLMRRVQRGHQNHPTENYVDIAYNFCACPHGYAYEGRGFKHRSGANGTTDANDDFAAVCVMLGAGDSSARFTPICQQTVSFLIRDWRSLGAGKAVMRHSYFTGTACPGPYIGAWVNNRGFQRYLEGGTTVPATDKVPDWLDDFVYWYLSGRQLGAERPASVPTAISQEVWDFTAAMHRLATHFGMSNGEREWIDWKIDGEPVGERPAVPTSIPKPWWNDHKFVVDQIRGAVAAAG
jgi:hypothetical protein